MEVSKRYSKDEKYTFNKLINYYLQSIDDINKYSNIILEVVINGEGMYLDTLKDYILNTYGINNTEFNIIMVTMMTKRLIYLNNSNGNNPTKVQVFPISNHKLVSTLNKFNKSKANSIINKEQLYSSYKYGNERRVMIILKKLVQEKFIKSNSENNYSKVENIKAIKKKV